MVHLLSQQEWLQLMFCRWLIIMVESCHLCKISCNLWVEELDHQEWPDKWCAWCRLKQQVNNQVKMEWCLQDHHLVWVNLAKECHQEVKWTKFHRVTLIWVPSSSNQAWCPTAKWIVWANSNFPKLNTFNSSPTQTITQEVEAWPKTVVLINSNSSNIFRTTDTDNDTTRLTS